MRNLTMAGGCLDAPCHRAKRLEFWRVFIDAERLASDFLDALVSYRFFPIPEIHWPHSHQFRSGRLASRRRNRDFTT
jgi:hypothetical protein